MKNKNNKWLETKDSDYFAVRLQRVICGNLTEARKEAINNFIDRYNEDNRYPYGRSSHGYAFTCGCSHDCCGHLTRTHMTVKFRGDTATITKEYFYNY